MERSLFRLAILKDLADGKVYYVNNDLNPNVFVKYKVDIKPFRVNDLGKKYAPEQIKMNLKRYKDFFSAKIKKKQIFIEIN